MRGRDASGLAPALGTFRAPEANGSHSRPHFTPHPLAPGLEALTALHDALVPRSAHSHGGWGSLEIFRDGDAGGSEELTEIAGGAGCSSRVERKSQGPPEPAVGWLWG